MSTPDEKRLIASRRRSLPGDVSRGAKLWLALLLVLVLIIGAGNLWATYAEVNSFKAQFAAQQRVQQELGKQEVGKLCSTFGHLAALKPPAGDAAANPSRAYEQQLHSILSGVVVDIGCP